MQYLIGYILLSLIVMTFFIEVNKKQIKENYLNFESKYNSEPTVLWFNIYILVQYLKSPLWCPMVILLILGNGGKLIK